MEGPVDNVKNGVLAHRELTKLSCSSAARSRVNGTPLRTSPPPPSPSTGMERLELIPGKALI